MRFRLKVAHLASLVLISTLLCYIQQTRCLSTVKPPNLAPLATTQIPPTNQLTSTTPSSTRLTSSVPPKAATISTEATATTVTPSTTSTTTTTFTKPTKIPSQQQPPRRQQPADDEYLIGVGIADITGPSADINLMGYAKPNQDAGGIHLRQFSRAIVIEDGEGKRLLYLSIDNGMTSQLLRQQVLKRLKSAYGDEVYSEENVMISGGFFQYMLYNIPSAGFISQTLEALVDGIVRSVDRASERLKPGRIFYNEGDLLDASVNRSPTSYENNPVEERANYRYDTDKQMHLLKVVDKATGEPMAMVSWFAVHGTSMNSSNHLISGDNKGYASQLFEQDFNPTNTLPGKGEFVAIFAQANEGDVSPNTRGPRCIDTGLPCDHFTSTCGNPPRNEKCIASGPGKDMYESTKIIAFKQYQRARQLFMDERSQVAIRGPIRFVHEHIDMTRQVVPLYRAAWELTRKKTPGVQLNASYTTCPASLGYSFAAGTTDGPGAFDFLQGDRASGRYWNLMRDFLRRPSEKLSACHAPKPILLSTGEMDFPYMWHPKVVPTQIIMIGQLAVVGLPGEFTTMAGRRVRNAVREILFEGASRGTTFRPPTGGGGGVDDETDEDEDGAEAALGNPLSVDDSDNEMAASTGVRAQRQRAAVLTRPRRRNKRGANSRANEIKVVLSGLSNIYTSYVTTIEEYQVQRYEGASTLYGPHTLQAYVNQFSKLAAHLISDRPLPPNDLYPPDLTSSLFALRAGVIFDGAPHGLSFGSLLEDVQTSRVYRCQETVSASFVAGNPRNDLRQEDSFLYLDRYTGNGTWLPVATDASWETKFIWERTNTLMGESKATLVWDIPYNCVPGVYRLRHYGSHKSLLSQSVNQYSGQSSPFKVAANQQSFAQEAQLERLLESAIEELKTQQANQKRLDQLQVEASAKPSMYSPQQIQILSLSIKA